MVDTSWSRLAYRIILVTTAVLAFWRLVGTTAVPEAKMLAWPLCYWRHAVVMLACGIACVRVVAAEPPTMLALSALAGVVLTLIPDRREAVRRAFRYLGFGLLCVIAVSSVVELSVVQDLSQVGPARLSMTDWHLNYVFGAGDQLVADGRLFATANPRLGLAVPVLLAGWQRAFGWVSVSDLIHATSLTNAVFVILVFTLYVRLENRTSAPAILGLVVAYSWLHAHHASVLYPNQSAVRHLNFAWGLWGMWWLFRLPFRHASTWLGPICAALVLYNLETGVAVSCGVVVGFLIRHRATLSDAPGAWGELIGKVALGCVAVMGAGILACRVLLSSWPALRSGSTFMGTVAAFSSGYGGTWEPLPPFVYLVLGHSLFVVLEAASRQGATRPMAAHRAGVATCILVWCMYYVNRVHPWNLWTLQVLYGCLLLDLFRYGRTVTRRGMRFVGATSIVLLGVVVLPHVQRYNVSQIRQFWDASRATDSSPSDAPLVSGVRINRDIATQLERRAAALRTGTESTVYVSAYPFLMTRLAGVRSTIPFADAYFSVFTVKEYRLLLDSLVRSDTILFEPQRSEVNMPRSHRTYMGRLQDDLTVHGYGVAFKRSGWEYWRRSHR